MVFSLIAYSTLIHPLFVSGPVKFIADNLDRIFLQLVTHIRIVGISLIIAIAAGVPVGIYITRHPSIAGIVLYISSILITIPSIAMFGFMMPILSSIDKAWDAVSGIGIGAVPAIVALALYSLLPIIRNTYIALKNVDPATIEAGKGMGMTNFQLLVQLQLPICVSFDCQQSGECLGDGSPAKSCLIRVDEDSLFGVLITISLGVDNLAVVDNCQA